MRDEIHGVRIVEDLSMTVQKQSRRSLWNRLTRIPWRPLDPFHSWEEPNPDGYFLPGQNVMIMHPETAKKARALLAKDTQDAR